MRRIFLIIGLAGCGGGGPVPTLPDKIVGHCTYTNSFSKLEECRDYVGEWTEQEATDDCRGQGQAVVLGTACDSSVRLGYCVLGASPRFTRITFPGDDADSCGSLRRGCEFFARGSFDPSEVCGGEPTTSPSGLPTFLQPVRTCVDPKAGEPVGRSEGGKVCTWEAISGATEEGRSFSDYASCDRVRTQRPYYPVPAGERAGRPDERLEDPAYAAELGWVKSQVRAAACTCCHSSSAPQGVSNWSIDSAPNFVDSFFDRGLAMAAGWIDTVGFGAYPPEQNNGFSRASPERPDHGIFPTTDDARLRRFFEGELLRRGITRSRYPAASYGAGPLDDQRFYVPEACSESEGIGAGGALRWLNGRARYVYVLEAGAANPTVPPNLDLPLGTRWRLDVPPQSPGLASAAVTYGTVPGGATQRFPVEGRPAPLVSGNTYYLYVLADVGQPNTRCLFTAP